MYNGLQRQKCQYSYFSEFTKTSSKTLSSISRLGPVIISNNPKIQIMFTVEQRLLKELSIFIILSVASDIVRTLMTVLIESLIYVTLSLFCLVHTYVHVYV